MNYVKSSSKIMFVYSQKNNNYEKNTNEKISLTVYCV